MNIKYKLIIIKNSLIENTHFSYKFRNAYYGRQIFRGDSINRAHTGPFYESGNS